MNGDGFVRITARANPLLQRVARLARDPVAYRSLGQIWLEGDHLCESLALQPVAPAVAVLAERALPDPRLRALADRAARRVVVPDALFDAVSGLDSAGAGVGMLVDLPALARRPAAGEPGVVLDRVQDPGNVGSILRSAAALGFTQVLALPGTAALWSAKVLRAAMGAHFSLRLAEGVGPPELADVGLPLVATDVHAGEPLPRAPLPDRCVWVFGHEGRGVDPALLQRCALRVRIPQPGGQESLNVAAAAAVCLYESVRRRAESPPAGA